MEKCSGLGSCAVRWDDGTINVEDTLRGLRTQLEDLALAEEEGAERIATAVHAVFDQYKGQTLNMPSLVNAALAHLSVTPATFAAESAAVADFIRLRKTEFRIAKGKGGGVTRICDAPPPKA